MEKFVSLINAKNQMVYIDPSWIYRVCFDENTQNVSVMYKNGTQDHFNGKLEDIIKRLGIEV